VEPAPFSLKQWFVSLVDQWRRFWFAPAAPHTLALVRILGGAMLLYTHLVWGLQLTSFLGPHALVDSKTAQRLNDSVWSWSYLYYVQSPAWLWTLHIAALIVFAMLMVGWFTRVTSILACVITLSYCHRLVGLQFGLDQVNALLAMYLAIGPCGAVYSVDHWLASRRANAELAPQPSVSANIAVRLIQVHMCVIYLFGGIAKLQGETWLGGTAAWYAIANYEYQSIDMTWLAGYPLIIALATHATVFWETFYCVLIWPRLTRPIFLAMAVMVHGGIALFLGMITFGLAMIIANLAFVPPETVQWCISAARSRLFGERSKVSESGERRGVSPTWSDTEPRRANAATLA
jgi:hypothetical protein